MIVIVLGFVSWATFVKETPASDPNTDWTAVAIDTFSVRIPDGWTVARSEDSIVDGDCASCLNHVNGKRAVVLTGGPTLITRERQDRFFITSGAAGETVAHFFDGFDEVGAISAKNATGSKYYKRVTSVEELGYHSGTRLYGYALAKDSNIVFIRYAALPDKADQHEIVETLIRTLELK